MRVVVLDDWENVAENADWSSLGRDIGVTVITGSLPDHKAVVDALDGADVVVAMRERTRLPASLLEMLPDLRLIVTTGASNAAIDLDACRRGGIRVCGTGSHPGGPVELTWALILAASRRLDRILPGMSAGEWPSIPGLALHGRTLGLLGLGRVGSDVAQVGAAFGMNVLAWSPTLTPERAAASGAQASSFDDVISAADVLSLHLPLNNETRNLVDQGVIARMRSSAWLINTSRAGLIDETAMRAALDAGGLKGAALDVFAREPLPAEDALRTHPNVILTPHLGYVTDLGLNHWFDDVIEDIAAWRSGVLLRVVV